MSRRGFEVSLLGIVCLVVLISQSTLAVLNVESIKMDPEAVQWFDLSDSQFQLKNLGGMDDLEVQAGDIKTVGSAEFDYAFDGSISITPCAMMPPDASYLGWAAAQFEGSSIMTVTVTKIWEAGNSANELLNNPSGVVLLTAIMSANPWYVMETDYLTNFFAGDNSYSMQSGELFDGSIMNMGNFQGYFRFPETGPGSNITAFNQDLQSNQPAITLIDPNPVPEPVSLVLLGVGALFLRKRQ